MSADRVQSDWLYLFSSNQSPRYAQDIVNVLACPRGAHYTFRYDGEYLESSTRDQWRALEPTGDEPGAQVLVLFSIQQIAKFYAPVFLPVRRGEVIETDVVGTRYYVTFRLNNPAAIRLSDVDRREGRHHEAVMAFTETIKTLTETPYAASASLGRPFRPDEPTHGLLDVSPDADVGFEHAVDFLGRTESFADFAFFRVRQVAETNTEKVATLGDDGTLILNAGTSYELQIVQSQVASPAVPRTFDVDTDGSILKVVGLSGFSVASRYDRPIVALHALAPASPLEERQTVLDVHPAAGVLGPSVAIPVRVKPDKSRAVGVATLQTIALLLVALAGVLSDLPLGVRIFFAVAGALGAAALQLFGTSALKAPSLPSAKPPTAAPTPAGTDPKA